MLCVIVCTIWESQLLNDGQQNNVVMCICVIAAFKIIRNSTKTPGTLSHTYANKHMCIFN